MKKLNYDDEVMKYVNFWIPKRYIDMMDELACKHTNGNRTKLLLEMIKRKRKEEKEND